jgi:hypothetical protein
LVWCKAVLVFFLMLSRCSLLETWILK